MSHGHQFVPKNKKISSKKIFPISIDFPTRGTHILELSYPKAAGITAEEKNFGARLDNAHVAFFLTVRNMYHYLLNFLQLNHTHEFYSFHLGIMGHHLEGKIFIADRSILEKNAHIL